MQKMTESRIAFEQQQQEAPGKRLESRFSQAREAQREARKARAKVQRAKRGALRQLLDLNCGP